MTDTAELTEEGFQRLTALSKPEAEKDFNAVMKKPQLTIIAVKDIILIVEETADHFFVAKHFMERCMKFKQKIEAKIVL